MEAILKKLAKVSCKLLSRELTGCKKIQDLYL